MNWNQWLLAASLKLNKSISSRRDAEILLEKVLHRSRSQILAFGDTLLSKNELIKLESLISRRAKGEPVAYLIKSKEFWSLNFKILPGVFIPRPDTECVVEKILDMLDYSYLHVLDLGTGVGNIALALASERPNWKIIGIDRQKLSLFLARKNKIFLGCKNVKFMYGNWFKNIKNKKFDLIVSNPPYIAKRDFFLLTKDIKFEPLQSLVSKKLGLSDLTIISQNSIQYLNPNGWLFLEHGWNQGKYMRKLLSILGFVKIDTLYDYNHLERVTYGQRFIA